MDYSSQPDEVKKEISQILERHGRMATARSTFENHWQECMDYINPRKGEVTSSRTPGDKRGAELFDTTAIMSLELLAGALHGMLTNPATQFFDFVMGDPDFDDDEEVKTWLQDSAQRVFHVMNNSNFQTEVHENYLDIGNIGTSCMFVGEHEKFVVHFNARPIKEIFVAEDNLGRIDTVHREFDWTPRQIIQEFGEENAHPYVLKKYKEGCEDKWKIIHAVAPKQDDKPYFNYDSVYLLKEQKLRLHKGGFPEMPYAVPRWTKTAGEVYGRGPGMAMLPDIKMVNKMMETTLKGAQKTVDPPLMVSDDGVIGKVRLTPGGLTVVRQTNGDAPIRPLITDARIDFGYQAVEDVRKRIRSGFYVDQLQLNEGPQMTATEVMQRTEEKLRLMGPVLGRQHFEFLRPVIERVFAIMNRKKLIKPAPDKIKGKGFDVRYSSMIARTQRMSEAQNITRAFTVAAPIINVSPQSMDVINPDKYLRRILDIHGVPSELNNTENEIKKIRDARAEAQAQAAQEQQQQHQADMAQKVLPGVAAIQQSSKQQ